MATALTCFCPNRLLFKPFNGRGLTFKQETAGSTLAQYFTFPLGSHPQIVRGSSPYIKVIFKCFLKEYLAGVHNHDSHDDTKLLPSKRWFTIFKPDKWTHVLAKYTFWHSEYTLRALSGQLDQKRAIQVQSVYFVHFLAGLKQQLLVKREETNVLVKTHSLQCNPHLHGRHFYKWNAAAVTARGHKFFKHNYRSCWPVWERIWGKDQSQQWKVLINTERSNCRSSY